MTQENDKTLGDIEQIAAHAREGLEALELLQQSAPDYSEDIRELQEDSLKMIAGPSDLADRMKGENPK